MAKKSGYSKMYMIPPSVWELVKRYINNLDMQRLEQLNAERESQVSITPGDRILSNVSSQDINPIDISFRSRSDLGNPNITQTQEFGTETYNLDPSMHESDRSRSILNPDSEYANVSTRTIYPTQETIQQIDMDEPPKMVEGPKTIVTRPQYATTEYIQDFPIVPSTSLTTINKPPPIIRRVRKPQAVTFTKPLPVSFKKSIPISFKKPLALTFKRPPLSYTKRKRSNDEYIEPMNISDKQVQSQEYSTNVDYDNPYISESFGRMPAPELSTTLNDPDVSRISFDPKIFSTPIRGHKLPTIVEEPEPSPIPIPILPLPSCSPKTSGTSKTSRKSKSSSYNVQTRSKSALAKPYNLPSPDRRSRVQKETTTTENFKCPMCNAKFTKKGSVESHLRVIHNINRKTTSFDRWKV